MQSVRGMTQGAAKRRNFLESLEFAERQKGTTRCLRCGAYTRGLIADGKRWFEEHIEREHGETIKRHR